MKHETGRTLKDGTEILLGDKLKGSQTAEVVVLFDNEKNEVGVQVIEHPEFWFTLDRFLFAWSDLIKTGSILERV